MGTGLEEQFSCLRCGDLLIKGGDGVVRDITGFRHVCQGSRSPEQVAMPQREIGVSLQGRVVASLAVKDRRLTLLFEDGAELEVSASGRRLGLLLRDGARVLRE